MTTNRKRHLKSEFAPNQTSSTIRQLPLICQMLAKFSGVESERTASKFRIKTKNKKQKTTSTGTKCIQSKKLWESTFGRRILGVREVLLCVLGMCE